MSEKIKPFGWSMSISDAALNESLINALNEAIASNPLVNKNNFLQDLVTKGLSNNLGNEPKEVIKEVEVIKEIEVDVLQNLFGDNPSFENILNSRIESGLSNSLIDLVSQCIDFSLRYNQMNYDKEKIRIKDFGFAVPNETYEPIKTLQNFYDQFK